jgi:hypothetical protein
MRGLLLSLIITATASLKIISAMTGFARRLIYRRWMTGPAGCSAVIDSTTAFIRN